MICFLVKKALYTLGLSPANVKAIPMIAIVCTKPAAQKLTLSENKSCNVALSFESCRKILYSWQPSYDY